MIDNLIPPPSNPFDRSEEFVRWIAKWIFGLADEEVKRIKVAVDTPPLGVRWIGIPVGYLLAKHLRRAPTEIASEIAAVASVITPNLWAYEVVADRGFVNVRWA